MLLIIGATFLQAQSLPTTDGPSCVNCVPSGWNKIGTPSVSNPSGIGGNNVNNWAHPVASPASGNSSFLAIQKDALHIDAASTVITDLVPGTKYYLKYSVMSASTSNTKYGTSATVKLVQGGAFPYTVTSQTDNFTEGVNTGTWISKTISFTAITEKIELHFDGAAGSLGGFVFLDIPKNAVFSTCPSYPGQVSLKNNSITNECPKKTVDLTSLVNGNAPAAAAVKWFDNPNHSGAPITDPTEVVAGTYYAFFYNATQDCYNTHNSTAKVTFTRSFCCGQEAYIQVSTSEVVIACPEKTTNLNNLITSSPPGPGFVPVWFTSPLHTLGPPIPDPTKAPGGIGSPIIYYPFYYNQALDCYNVEFSNAPVLVIGCCSAGDSQITLNGNSISNACPVITVNLNSLYSGNLPATSSLKWFDNPSHSGTAVSDPTMVGVAGVYYAFLWDEFNNCYNTDNSTAQVTVTINTCPVICNAGDGQVPVKPSISNICPSGFGDLHTALTGNVPDLNAIKWFTTPNHAPGTQVTKPFQVVGGTYYAFYYDAVNDCYNTANSTAAVNVSIHLCGLCKAGTSQVPLKRNANANICPAYTVNLNTMMIGAAPAGSTLVWFKNSLHEFSAIADPTMVGAGDYYAFFYDAVNDCYNTDLSTAMVTVTITNCDPCSTADAVILSNDLITNSCPATTVDLTSLVVNGFQKTVLWFTDIMHSGPPIVDPANVSTPGTYYAFFYDAAFDCYNGPDGGEDVTVTINACPTVPATLDLKVKLQGAMASSGINMRTDLQNYFGENLGLLPTTDPYGFGKTYSDINNISGAAGKVVDWVLVEIRSAASPTMVLQSKVLLLKPNGSIVETDGTQPVFQPESLVHITIKHRNHVAIMSNRIVAFQGAINYDFTTDLSQAYNVGYPVNPTAPPQMILTNGVWCMWAGDIDQNLALNPNDYNTILSANGGQQGEIYMNTDINMDGGMDATDMNIIFSNNLVEPYSILSIY